MVAKSARFLAPIALAAVAVGVYLIVHSTVVHHTTTATQSNSPTVANGAKHKARKHVACRSSTSSSPATR